MIDTKDWSIHSRICGR